MLKKMTRCIRSVCMRLFLLPVAERIIKLGKIDFCEFYYVYRTRVENTMRGMSYDEFANIMNSNYMAKFKNYPECYSWLTTAATLSWKFYNT